MLFDRINEHYTCNMNPRTRPNNRFSLCHEFLVKATRSSDVYEMPLN